MTSTIFRWGLGAALAFGCAGSSKVLQSPVQTPPSEPSAKVAMPAAAGAASSPTTPGAPADATARWKPVGADPGARALALFGHYLKEQGDLDYPELAKRLNLTLPAPKALPFDPTKVRFYADAAERLKLTPEEQRIFRQRGVVGVDHAQRYSMGSAYHAIYTRDLPVLVTTDSILHALHRSFDATLKELETNVFTHSMKNVLSRTAATLAADKAPFRDTELRASAEDVDLYLAVARSLLNGAGAPPDEPAPGRFEPQGEAPEAVTPKLVEPAAVASLIRKASSLDMETPENGRKTALYGGKRFVDWSQFRPRGHYTQSMALRRYFRAMMWLGRPDLGWTLRAVDPVSGLRIAPGRELRSAALFVLTLERSGELGNLAAISNTIDFMVGRSDNVSIADVQAALKAAGITKPAELAGADALGRIDRALDASGVRAQQIRSQVLDSDESSQKPTDLPLGFQVFGQRFVIDSFALSRVVYDGILYKGEKQKRMMPTGLDVMAALGSDEATRLLEAELDRWHYGSNLLAARRVAESMTKADWSENAYTSWLAALRTLDDTSTARAFPAVMKTEAWRRKQLQTQLGSWAELRHDTILYAKQSYTSSLGCEYPAGFVEPYPEFFDRLEELTGTLSKRLTGVSVPFAPPDIGRSSANGQSRFFEQFSQTMARLGDLARAELAGRPFSAKDKEFLKQTIDIRGGGSGGPYYTGWYPQLIYGGNPDAYEPSVADVHTDPNSGAVLEEAVGDVGFVVVAVDNGPDRMAYVGPVYSYYEFTTPARKRMTDEEWSDAIRSRKVPPRPSFTRVFQPPAVERTLERVTRKRSVPPPRRFGR